LYLKLSEVNKNSPPFEIIIAYLGLQKSGKNLSAKTFLKDWLKQINQKDWTTQILKYFDSQITSNQLLAQASNVRIYDRKIEAHIFIGEKLLLENNKTKAKVHFKWVRDNADKTFPEYLLAIAELKRLE
jgi:lipoprotein NlpI